MPDNTILNPGVGGDTIATDDIGGVKHELVKLEFGADGSATMVDPSNPLPTADAIAQAALASIAAEDFATHAAQIDNSQKTQLVDAAGNPVTVTGNKLDVNATFSGDIEIGAVELKNATTDDRTAVINTAPTTEFGLVTRNIPSGTQPVSAASLPLPSGAATSANQQTNAITDAQIRATPLPISGTVSTNGLTDAQLRASAVPVTISGGGGGAVTIADGADTTEGAIADAIVAAGATGTLSAKLRRISQGIEDLKTLITVLPLPTGASTSALQTTGNTSLGTIAGKDFATQTTLAALLAKIIAAPSTEAKQDIIIAALGSIDAGTAAALGQALMAASVPVVIASNQSAIPVSGTFFQATQPVSAATLPLPTGASTEATLALVKAKTDNIDVALSTRTKPSDQQHVIIDSGGGGATTIADGADVTEGAIADAIVAAGATGTVSAKLRRVTQGLEDLKAGITALPLPTGAATGAKQDTGNTSLASIDSKLTNPLPVSISSDIEIGAVELKNGTDDTRATVTAANALKVDGSAVTQPISAATLPLPTGAATAALQTQPGVDIGDVTVNNATGAGAVNIQDGGNSITVDGTFFQVTQPVSAAALPLPTGAATAANQQTNAITDAQIRATPLPVSGTVSTNGLTDTQLRATPVPVSNASLPLPTGAATEATLADIEAGIPEALGQTTMANSMPVVIASNQSAVPISGTVTVDTSLLATAAKQDTGNTSSASILAKIIAAPSTEAKQDTIITALATLLTISDFDSKTGSLTETAPATDTASSGLNGRLQRIAQRLTSLITALGSPFQAGGSIGNTTFPVADGGNVAIGALADAIVAAGATGSLSAKLRRATQGLEDLKSLIVLAAGTNLIGKVGIDQTTPGTTNGVQVNAALPAGNNNIGDVDIVSLPALAAGTALIGKVGIDQTTDGTTNKVRATATQKPSIGATVVMTVTALQSLASSATAGWQSARVSNLSTLATDYEIMVKLTTANTAPANDKAMYVFISAAYTSDAGSTWFQSSQGTTTLPTGAEGTTTIASPHNLRLLGVLNYTTQQAVVQDTFLLSNCFGNRLPDGFSIIIINFSGAALSTGCIVDYSPLNDILV